MSELLIITSKWNIPRPAADRLVSELRDTRGARKVHHLMTHDPSAPDIRIFDLDKLPDAEAKEVVRIVKGVVAK